jgi:tight adherence protein B
MNWRAGAGSAALVAAATVVLCGLVGAERARRASARLVPRLPSSPDRRIGCRLPAPSWFGPRLESMGSGLSPDVAWTSWLIGAAVACLGSLEVGGPGLALLMLAAALALPGVAWLIWRGRSEAEIEASLPDALEAVARGLRSGASLRLALAEAGACGGPLATDLQRVSAEVELGADVATTLERWGDIRPVPGVRLAVAALCLGAEAGGPQARAVDGVAATLRQRLAVAAEGRALGAQARVSGLVIALSPVAFCTLASSTDGRTARFLLHSTTGQLLLAAGITLDLIGALWMSALTRVPA